MRAAVIAVSLLFAGQGPVFAQDAKPDQAPATAPQPAPAPAPEAAKPPAATQPSNNDVRISGTVQKFQDGMISISPSQGVVLTIRFGAGPGINSMRRGKVSDLKSGEQVTVQAKSNPSGGLLASQVIVYEAGSENVAGMQASTDPSQVVAKITDIGSAPEGPQLSLAYKDGERKVTMAKEAVIWIARPASADDIKPGAIITIAGQKPPEGEIKVIKASIGPAGGDNPPL